LKTVFYIDGGAGRVIAAIPALLKYAHNHPQNDWCIIVPSWHYLYWGIPQLQCRTYDSDNKGVFENLIIDAQEFITPEPYRLPSYYRQEISLAQAFDKEINQTDDHSDLQPPIMIFNKAEIHWAKNMLNTLQQEQGKNKTILFQPFGRGARIDAQEVIDDGSRSLSADAYIMLAKKLSVRFNLIFMGDPEFQIQTDTYSHKMPIGTDLRMWASLINQVDYLVGIDSVAQHIARAVNTPGTVIFGSTFPVNTSYPDWFQIIERDVPKKYTPIRIAGLDSQLADRFNDPCMNFDSEEINQIYQQIVNHIQKTII
jgi:ADP-heptose:LPS heptosyltransferase